MLATNRLSTVYQRLRASTAWPCRSPELRRYVAVALPEEAKAERATPLKDDPPAGEEGQVDYGRLWTLRPLWMRRSKINEM